jgi:hypothetical protein
MYHRGAATRSNDHCRVLSGSRTATVRGNPRSTVSAAHCRRRDCETRAARPSCHLRVCWMPAIDISGAVGQRPAATARYPHRPIVVTARRARGSPLRADALAVTCIPVGRTIALLLDLIATPTGAWEVGGLRACIVSMRNACPKRSVAGRAPRSRGSGCTLRRASCDRNGLRLQPQYWLKSLHSNITRY